MIVYLNPDLQDLLCLASTTLNYKIVCEGTSETIYRIVGTNDYTVELVVCLEEIYPIFEYLEENGHDSSNKLFTVVDGKIKYIPIMHECMEELYGDDMSDLTITEIIADLIKEKAYIVYTDIHDISAPIDLDGIRTKIEFEIVQTVMNTFDCNVQQINELVEKTFPKFSMTKAAR